ncbi:hypothetical protein KVT40_000791 [Elsinoe batatas]|uniref:Uncharacterized protein n=1 Tax=Elsinoe batatas TaxID=2601811 RepID=A0A8K0PIZ3_9PEZI|nr:hypothetical protein KVT40_000791 [Elsinoe batatas]
MPPPGPINFQVEDELNTPAVQSNRERFLSQPNISQPRAAKVPASDHALNLPDVRSPPIVNGSQQATESDNAVDDQNDRTHAGHGPDHTKVSSEIPRYNKPARRGKGKGGFGRRLSKKHNEDGRSQNQPYQHQPQYIPYHPGATFNQNPHYSTVHPDVDPARFGHVVYRDHHDAIPEFRPATAGPHFGPIDFNPGALSHATHTMQNQSENFNPPRPSSSSAPPPSHLINSHTNNTHTNNNPHSSPKKIAEMPKEPIDPLAMPPPKLGNYFPGVPIAHLFAPNKPIRPVDLLHSHMEGLNRELDRIMAAVNEPSQYPDPQITAWKEDVLNRLAAEIIPGLTVTTTRVANAIRDGMYANSGGIRIQTGGYGFTAPSQMAATSAHYGPAHGHAEMPASQGGHHLNEEDEDDYHTAFPGHAGQHDEAQHDQNSHATHEQSDYGQRVPIGPRTDRSYLHGRTQGQPSGYNHGVTQGQPTGHLHR